MSKMYYGQIDVTKIDKTKLFKSDKTGRVYLDLTIWVNDEPDQYGNSMAIQQTTPKDHDKIYLGNCKMYVKPNLQPQQENQKKHTSKEGQKEEEWDFDPNKDDAPW